MTVTRAKHSVESTNLADLLERILDKGMVIAGDIKIKLVDIELLTLQIRLVVCSVEKASEIGIAWWEQEKMVEKPVPAHQPTQWDRIEERLERLENAIVEQSSSGRTLS